VLMLEVVAFVLVLTLVVQASGSTQGFSVLMLEVVTLVLVPTLVVLASVLLLELSCGCVGFAVWAWSWRT